MFHKLRLMLSGACARKGADPQPRMLRSRAVRKPTCSADVFIFARGWWSNERSGLTAYPERNVHNGHIDRAWAKQEQFMGHSYNGSAAGKPRGDAEHG